MWRSAKNPRKLQGCPYYYQDFGLPAWKDWRRRPLAPPTFIECGAATVKTHVDYNGYGNRPLTDLYRHMKTCADVQALSLSILARGCVIDWEAPFSFDFQRRDIFPSTLENLTISGYHWDDKAYGSLNQAEAWHNAMNWFSLKRLDIDRPPQSFLDTLSGRLPNLESLTIRPHSSPSGTEHTFCSFDERAKSMRQNYTSFITSMPPLQELHLSGMGEHLDLEPILAVHGSSLRNLTIHELEGDCAYETGNATWTRPHLGVGAIKTINRMAPKLRALTVDLYRNAMYLPHSEIDAIAKLPNLEELTLHFDLENPRRKYISRTCMILGPNRHKERKLYCAKHELLEPRITPADPWDIVDRLRRPDGKSVEKLTVVVGNYHRFEGSIGLPVHFYMDPNQPYMYECRAGDVSCETFGGWNDTEKNKYTKAPPAYIEEWDLWGGEEIRDEL